MVQSSLLCVLLIKHLYSKEVFYFQRRTANLVQYYVIKTTVKYEVKEL
jgi:hypothetical protein